MGEGNKGASFGPGSRPSDQAASHLAPAGFDPSRVEGPSRIDLPGGYYLCQIQPSHMTCSLHMADGLYIGNLRSEYAGDFAEAVCAPGIEAAEPPRPEGVAEGESPAGEAGAPDLAHQIQDLTRERDEAMKALTRLVSSFEGDDLPFTDEQEAAYEAAATFLDAKAG